MTIQLTAAQTLLWADAQWRAGFLAALEYGIPDEVLMVKILNDGGAQLAAFARVWTAVP